MNERILELALQAGFDDRGSNHTAYMNFDHEKFAGLIVRECIQVGGPEDSYTDDWFKAKADSINKIKEHFGVEK